MSKPKKQKTKRRFFTPKRLFVLLLIIAILVMGAWLALRTAIVKGAEIGIGNMEAQGYQIAHGGLNVGGFPLSINATSSDISVQAPSGAQDDLSKNWSVKLSDLNFGTATVTPLSWQIRHRGDMRVDMRGAGGERYMFDITPAKIDARGAVNFKGKLKAAQIDIGKATINPLVGTPPPILGAKDTHIDVKISGANAKLDINAHDVVISDKAMGLMDEVLGTRLDEVLGTRLSQASLTMAIENWAELETNGPEAWKENGGRLTSDNWIVHWGKVDFIGDFDVYFKDGLPEGAVHVRAKNGQDLVRALYEVDMIDSMWQQILNDQIANFVLDKDDRGLVTFSIRKGVVKWGVIPIYTFE